MTSQQLEGCQLILTERMDDVAVGAIESCSVGAAKCDVGATLGATVGDTLGIALGLTVGAEEGATEGVSEGAALGLVLGSAVARQRASDSH